MDRINGLTFKASKKKQYKWPFSKEKVKRFNELCNKKVSEEELHEQLERAHIYYLDKHGLSIENNTIINVQNAKIKLAELDSHTSEYKHIYAWMRKQEDGTYRNIAFGTRYEFDKMIIGHLQDTKKSKNNK